MTKEEAIKECEVEAEKYGDIFGDWHVIMKGRDFHAVSGEYLISYKHFGKIYHTVKAEAPKDVDLAEEIVKKLLLTFCKTRGDRRKLERQVKKLKKGGLIEFFKKFKRIRK